MGSSCTSHSEGLHEAVARMAMSRPDALALTSGRRTMTYRELDRTADAWAAQLVAAGVAPGHCVPIALSKSARLVVALLAVLKSGAAYALLEPAWPVDRLREVIGQLATPLLVAVEGTVERAAVPVWTPTPGPIAVPADFRPIAVEGAHPCCVFFTSGTTGRPKGVVTPHRAISRLFEPAGFARFDTETVMPLAAPSAWDAFSLELWSVLLSGGMSVIVEDPYLSVESLRDGVSTHGVNTVWLTSSLFNMIVDEDVDVFVGIRYVMIGGERLSPAHVGRFVRRHPTIALINGYGPVESTVFATTHRIAESDCERPTGMPLGRPVRGTRVFVLDGSRPCDVGDTGEICVAGDGLALRYLGDPVLTDAKFPHAEIEGELLRIYRTGDLGWWDRDGLLHFRGRADRQLKIRGHRVEPAEVERQVERLVPSVRACRALARRDEFGTPEGLVAFCVPARPGDRLTNALGTLRSELVAHLCPVAVVSVHAFPLNTQGKLDERALLAMMPTDDARTAGATADGVQSRDLTSRLIAETFGAVLGRASVPVDVPYFELGGSSLGAGRVCARLAARLARPVPVSWLYQSPTVAGLANRLRSTGRLAARTIARVDPDAVPLTPMQVVYLTRHLVDPADRTGHCLLVWLICGDLDRASLESAIAAVHQRHEPLRAAYLPDPRPTACLVDIPAPPLEVLAGQPSLDAASRALRVELGDDLEPIEGEVWRTALVPVESGRVALFGCVVHHIAFDGWSESVLAEDLAAAYNAARGVSGPAARPSPPSLAAGYEEHEERLAQADLAAHREYLTTELASVPDLRWPAGHTETAPGRPGQREVALDADVVAAVDALAAETGVTRFVALLSLWARSLTQVTGQRDFAVGVPVAQRYAAGLEHAVGCHINMVCIRLRGAALNTDAAAVRETGRIVGRAFVAQDVPFADIVDLMNSPRSGRSPGFQTLFALQDNPIAQLPLTGLRTEFVRQPYLDLPLELHAEFWPGENGDMRLVISFRPQSVPRTTVEQLTLCFTDHLHTMQGK